MVGKFIRELRSLTNYVNVTSSDPGSTGIITPFAKTDGLYFDKSSEPQDTIYDLIEESNDYYGKFEEDEEIEVLKPRNNEEYMDLEEKLESVLDKSSMKITIHGKEEG